MNKKIFDYSYTLKKQKQHKDLMIFIYIVTAVIVISITFKLFLFPVKQHSTSMAPNIKKQSVLMVTPIVKTPARGDVVLLKAQSDNDVGFFKSIAAHIVRFCTAQQVSIDKTVKYPGTSEKIIRIIGVPGDTVYVEDYIAHVKPKNEKHFLSEFELCNKNYNLNIQDLPENWDKSFGFAPACGEVVLSENEYFVLSDNRSVYNDSRLWGTVKQENIMGRVLFSYFPFNSMKLY